MRSLLLTLLGGVVVSWPEEVRAQDAAKAEGTVSLEVRVGSAERGWALIDRGSADHLVAGDVVLFLPREGGTYSGTVIEVEERAARVELQDPAFVPAPGTRGKVQIPRQRLGRGARPRLRPVPGRREPDERPEPVFQNRDEDWQTGEPLLARVRAVRPEERAPDLHGRSYAILDYAHNSEDSRDDTFARFGTSLVVENPFGLGDRIHADAEWNYRHVNVPDLDDEEDVELRIDRLSYARGGTRFAPESLEIGRFLQGGMAEFGVLDGAEWIVRRRNGHRYGASIGFLPEPDGEFQTGSDFQVATFYRWVADESEELSAAAGYQKSFHNGATDRDLVVASVQRFPRNGWTLFCTTWIDLYTAGDDQKGTLFGLTQAYLGVGRRWPDRSSIDLVFSHVEFPEIDRNEFPPVEDDQLADDHNERLALRGGLQLGPDVRLRTAVGGWVDEDEQGGDVEVGFGLENFMAERVFADLSAFATSARFQTTVGARFTAGTLLDRGRLALDYEFSQNRLDEFSSANNDLPQHRLRLNLDQNWYHWNASWRIEGLLYDDEKAISVGLYLQRRHD